MFAGAVCRHFWVDEDRVEDVKIAVSEACTNAVKAHQAAGIADPVVVRAHFDGALLSFEVSDVGHGFEPSAEDAPDLTGLQEGSLGLTLIHALFENAYVVSGERGTTVRFSLPGSHPAEDQI
jgi:serine/threonine-protein kinase RsbW